MNSGGLADSLVRDLVEFIIGQLLKVVLKSYPLDYFYRACANCVESAG
jgi:hypothetical protein